MKIIPIKPRRMEDINPHVNKSLAWTSGFLEACTTRAQVDFISADGFQISGVEFHGGKRRRYQAWWIRPCA